MTGVDESLIREIVRRSLATTQPTRIIRFGSAATGQLTSASDLDLLVVVREESNTSDEHAKLQRALHGLGVPFNALIIRVERFNATKDIFGGIAYPAHRYGRVIYTET